MSEFRSRNVYQDANVSVRVLEKVRLYRALTPSQCRVIGQIEVAGIVISDADGECAVDAEGRLLDPARLPHAQIK